VTFTGDIGHDQIRDFYNLCDVFAMVNRLNKSGDVESFAMVFTEANAVGKPVIGGRSGGTAQAVLQGQTGFLVDPDSADEVASRLVLLLKNEHLSRRMGSAGLGRLRVESNWASRGQALREITAGLVMRAKRTPQSHTAKASPAGISKPLNSWTSLTA